MQFLSRLMRCPKRGIFLLDFWPLFIDTGMEDGGENKFSIPTTACGLLHSLTSLPLFFFLMGSSRNHLNSKASKKREKNASSFLIFFLIPCKI